MANGYSSESTRRELSTEYQYDRVKMIFRKFCSLVLWMKVASALEGLKHVKPNLNILRLGCISDTLSHKCEWSAKQSLFIQYVVRQQD